MPDSFTRSVAAASTVSSRVHGAIEEMSRCTGAESAAWRFPMRRVTRPGRRALRGGVCVLVAGCLLLMPACSSAAQPSRPAASDVVASVGQTTITLAQVDELALQSPVASYDGLKLSQALYEARRAVIDEMVGNALLDQEAQSRGIVRTALVDQEITAKVKLPTDADVETWYRANQDRVQGAPLEQLRAPIRAMLADERSKAARGAYLDVLKSKTPVKVTLAAPREVVAAAANSPVRGVTKAPVELVEFSDFQCPFCLRARPTVQKVLDTYGNSVRFVYRFYPLPNHPNARPAAEAAACADDQGKFWPYFDRLFAQPGNLADADLKKAGADVGLDVPKFTQCVDSHASSARIEADLRAGQDAGVVGTPTFFINGRELTGAQPFEEFKRLIDDELQAQGPTH
jgi:protein-disulfide isomerase